MRRLVLIAALVLSCKRHSEHPVPLGTSAADDDGGLDLAEVPNGSENDAPRVVFRIDHSYSAERPTTSPPWHQPGGDWMFYDAHTAAGVGFGFGYHQRGGGTKSLSFGEAMLTVPSAAVGAKLVDQFAQAFHGKMPPLRTPQPLRFRPFPSAILATASTRDPLSGFNHRAPGNWTATKLFLQRSGPEAEVFLNFDPVSKVGEFSEKDSDYADAMVAFLAGELRDGPRPRRTSATDGQISDVGPKIGSWQVVAEGATAYGFLGRSHYAFKIKDGPQTRLSVVSLDKPTEKRELFASDYVVTSVACADEEQNLCAVEEVLAKSDEIYSLAQPRRLTLLDRQQSTKLDGPWGDRGELGTDSLSPDGSTIAVTTWRQREGGPGSYETIYLVPRTNGVPRQIDLGPDSVSVIGWIGQGPTLRAILRKGDLLNRETNVTYLSVDPRTGSVIARDRPVGLALEDGTSPDGRYKVDCHDGVIVLGDRVSHREHRFVPHEDDREALAEECVGWAGPRYLRFDVDKRVGFIDIGTLKLSYMFSEDEDVGVLETSPDFRWAVSKTDQSIRVARIVVK
jgi:hypothetical protein